MANEMVDLADFDIIFQRVSQIRIVGKFIVTVCVTEQKGKRKKCLKKKHLVGQEEKGWNDLVYQGDGRGGNKTNSADNGCSILSILFVLKLIIRECTTSLLKTFHLSSSSIIVKCVMLWRLMLRKPRQAATADHVFLWNLTKTQPATAKTDGATYFDKI